MGFNKFLKVEGVLPSYFEFYRFCRGLGVPCITISRVRDVFVINVDHTSMEQSANEKKLELSYLYTEYVTRIEEVITFKSELHFADVSITVSGREEEIATKIFNDYIRIFEIKF